MSEKAVPVSTTGEHYPRLANTPDGHCSQLNSGKLWRTTLSVDGEPLTVVEVVNATPEPDGTRRRYFLRVPPTTRTAHEAVAWSFGFSDEADYVSTIET